MFRYISLFFSIITCQVALSASFLSPKQFIDGGNYYPGTEYSYNIYIPDGYTGEKEACLYLGFDGILCNAPKVFDELIAEGAMPPVIGVFVNPGIIKTDDGTVIRYNRSNEYDSTDNRLALWVGNILLKDVRKYKLPNGKTLKLSTNPDDCAVFGASSGGIAAFTLAWHRPDMFHRVFSAAGSFVSMRGGHSLYALIRKTEPKPLKYSFRTALKTLGIPSSDIGMRAIKYWFPHLSLQGMTSNATGQKQVTALAVQTKFSATLCVGFGKTMVILLKSVKPETIFFHHFSYLKKTGFQLSRNPKHPQNQQYTQEVVLKHLLKTAII